MSDASEAKLESLEAADPLSVRSDEGQLGGDVLQEEIKGDANDCCFGAVDRKAGHCRCGIHKGEEDR